MTTVKCPICKERVSAANAGDLNVSLREHMADVHDMRELTQGEREGMYRGTYTTGRYTEREMPREREYVSEERREPRESTMERTRERAEPERRRYDVVRDYPYTERFPEAGFNTPQSRTLREVETWSTRRPERYQTENYIPREEVRQWRYPVTGEYGERGPTTSERMRESTRGESYERRSNVGESTGRPSMVNCPMCGAPLRGKNEDDLSDELRDHLADVHDIKPKMSARLRY